MQRALNERSRHSALRMGFRFEGIQESHMIVKGAAAIRYGFASSTTSGTR
ncbi:MAG: hypothetical protein U0703_10345 [Anaerolineae bacterium]